MPDSVEQNKVTEPAAEQAKKPLPRKKKSVEEMGEYFYNMTKMHKIFFVSCLLMLVSFIWMIWQDYDREWKDYQRRFRALELARVTNDLDLVMKKSEKDEKEWKKIGELTLEDIHKRLEALKNLDRQKRQFELDGKTVTMTYEDIENELKQLQGRHELKQQEKNFRKSDYDHLRSFYEIAKEHYEEAKKNHNIPMEHTYAEDMKKYEKLMKDMQKELDKRTAEFDEVDKRRTILVQAQAHIEKDRDELRKEQKKLIKEREALDMRLKREGPSLTNKLRDAPMLDFLAPTLKIEQVVIDNLQDELHFAKVPKVERCHTCHKGIMNPAYEVDEKTGWFRDKFLREHMEKEYPQEKERRKFTQVFKSHPNLDLYLSSSSKHPLEKVGCTVCHQGDGTATEFGWAVHTPTSKAQEEDWAYYNKYSHRELWEHPMLPKQYIYSSCRKCHKGEVEIKTPEGIDAARPYNTAKVMFERLGCYGCHKTEDYPILTKDLPEIEPGKPNETLRARRPGPPLTHMKDKFTPDWAYKWLMDPRGFRPTTRMPKFFNQTNSRGKEYDEAMALSIVKYIYGLSDSRPYKDPPGRGDVARGEKIVQTVGCRACHVVGAGEDRAYDPAKGQSSILTEFGPNLNGVGSKVSRAWLYEWVREPKHYWTDTRMPDLRLTDQEVLDVTDYLLTLKNVEFEKKPGLPAVKDEIVDKIVMEQLRAKMSAADAQKELAEMSREPERKMVWLGERMVRNFGCYGCHHMEDRDKWRVHPLDIDEALAKKHPQKHRSYPERHAAWNFLRSQEGLEKTVLEMKEILDGVILAKIKEKLPEREAKTKLKAMSAEDKQKWVKDNLRIDRSGDWPNQEGIGVELSGPQAIGSKFTDRFDFGYKPYREHGLPEGYEIAKSLDPKILIPQTRHDWIFNKLKNPRMFDDGKDAKPPDELLRMPNFQLTDFEATHVVNYLLSLTTDHMRKETVKTLSSEEHAFQRGARLVRDFNCKACHRFSLDRFLVEIDLENPRTLMKEEKKQFWFEGEVTPYGDFVQVQEGNYFVDWIMNTRTLGKPFYSEQEVLFPLPLEGDASATLPDGRKVTWVRVLKHIPPDGGEIFEHIYFHKAMAEMKDAVEKLKDPNVPVSDKRDLFSKLNEKYRKKLPPLLVTEGHKVQGEWLFQFLKQPHDIRPSLRRSDDGLNVRMPTFGLNDEQSNALVRFFSVRDHAPYPYEHIPERDEVRLRAREPFIHKLLDATLDEQKQKKGMFLKVCMECHVVQGELPKDPDKVTEIGPDLARTQQRLKPSWLKAWLDQPARINPSTNMPPVPEGQGRGDTIQALVELLMNFDRYYKKETPPPPKGEKPKDEKPKAPEKPPEKKPQKQ